MTPTLKRKLFRSFDRSHISADSGWEDQLDLPNYSGGCQLLLMLSPPQIGYVGEDVWVTFFASVMHLYKPFAHDCATFYHRFGRVDAFCHLQNDGSD